MSHTRTVPSDDYVMTLDGVQYHPRVGETVTLAGFFDMNALGLMYEFGDALGRVGVDDPVVKKFIAALAERIVSWTWTNADGEPLPQPYQNPEAFLALALDEVVYLSLLAAPKLSEGQGVIHVPRRLRRRMRRK